MLPGNIDTVYVAGNRLSTARTGRPTSFHCSSSSAFATRAAIWADLYKWIPEAARLLRPGGRLIFLGNSSLVMMAVPDLETDGPATDRLLRNQFGMHRFEWPDSDGVEFHISHGDWIRLLRANDFEVEELVELRPSEDAQSRFEWVTADWARRWPSEEAWKARKREPGARLPGDSV